IGTRPYQATVLSQSDSGGTSIVACAQAVATIATCHTHSAISPTTTACRSLSRTTSSSVFRFMDVSSCLHSLRALDCFTSISVGLAVHVVPSVVSPSSLDGRGHAPHHGFHNRGRHQDHASQHDQKQTHPTAPTRERQDRQSHTECCGQTRDRHGQESARHLSEWKNVRWVNASGIRQRHWQEQTHAAPNDQTQTVICRFSHAHSLPQQLVRFSTVERVRVCTWQYAYGFFQG